VKYDVVPGGERKYYRGMNTSVMRGAARTLLVATLLLCAACATREGLPEPEAVAIEEELPVATEAEAVVQETPANETSTEEGTGEVALVVAETEGPADATSPEAIEEVVVGGHRERHELIRDLVAEAQSMLRDVELEYVFTGKGKREILRGRPVAFAVWSDAKQAWSMVHVEIPRPPVKWRPGRKQLPFRLLTPGVEARHVKGTGAERLMFAFSRDGEDLKVYGRKFPVFDNTLLKKKQWRAVAQTAKPIVYLPFTEDTLDPLFVSGGREFLLATARRAMEELRIAKVPSVAFPDQLLADVVPAEVITTLAVIEQTDDADYVQKGTEAFDEVLSHYGLKRGEAYRYSVSSAAAIGPMQFTNRRGNGTYALVVRRCTGARLDPNFERGATDLLNAMKAAICLFDIELRQMRADIRDAYWTNRAVLGIFPVAAYNGGPRNVTKLYNVLKKRMKLDLEELRRPGEQVVGSRVTCPCLWKQDGEGVIPVALPKYNNENRWYVEKYQNILGLFED
jgi:hypothetical protein